VSSFTTLIDQTKVYGESPSEFILSNFRITAQAALAASSSSNATMSIAVASSALESSSNAVQSSLSFAYSERSTVTSVDTVNTHVIQTYQRSYTGNSSQFYSDPLKVIMSSKTFNVTEISGNVFSEMILKLRNNQGYTNQGFGNVSVVNFTTVCTVNDFYKYTYICPYSSVSISNRCTGVAGVIVSYCPKVEAACNALDTSSFSQIPLTVCTTLNSTLEYTYCSCNLTAAKFQSNIEEDDYFYY
jgi:hypothetical protein